METKSTESVGREMAKKLGNESLAIIGAVVIAVTAIFVLGNNASEIVAAVGGGLVGYLSRQI